MSVTMEKLVALCKTRGFVFPGSDIYGGLANSWDYGPLGVELKNNVKQLWWKMFVQQRLDMVGIDAALIMNPKVWEASGHVATFTDPLVECKKCHERFRADHLVEKSTGMSFSDALSKFYQNQEGALKDPQVLSILGDITAGRPVINKETGEQIIVPKEEAAKFVLGGYKNVLFAIHAMLDMYKTKCPTCGSVDWSPPMNFNLMMKTWLGPKEDATAVAYFRPETAQAMFVDFPLVLQTSRKRVPFGIAQIGKAFRNEITPGNFIFRTREFEQMEIEYFVHPSQWETAFEEWRQRMHAWIDAVGIDAPRAHDVEIEAAERAHYSKRTVDIEFEYPFGQKELYGLAYRTDFDLSTHAKHSGANMTYTDPVTGEKYVPHVIEPSLGVDRTVLAVLLSAYDEEEAPTGEGGTETRVVLRLKPALAPIKAAILPLSKKDELTSVARPLAEKLAQRWRVDYDETQSIGKRYRRQDEIGTPFCVTVDFDSLNDQAVTVRARDSMKQERVPLAELEAYLSSKLNV